MMTVHEYVETYEFRGDTDYTPNDHEKTLIEDAIAGYLAYEAAKPAAEASGSGEVRPKDAVHSEGCEHSRSPIWLCDCPRPRFATPPAPATVEMPDDATPEMVAAALKVDWTNENEEAVVHNVWHALRAALAAPATDTPEGR